MLSKADIESAHHLIQEIESTTALLCQIGGDGLKEIEFRFHNRDSSLVYKRLARLSRSLISAVLEKERDSLVSKLRETYNVDLRI